jgi:hypothetical protein
MSGWCEIMAMKQKDINEALIKEELEKKNKEAREKLNAKA